MRQAELCETRAVKPWHVFLAGMLGMLVGGVIVWLLVRSEVHNANSTNARLGELERRTSSTEHLTESMGKLQTSLVKHYTALPTFGAEWWCNGGDCFRGHDTCTRLSKIECASQRIAWCFAGRERTMLACFTERTRCEVASVRLGKSDGPDCIGVE